MIEDCLFYFITHEGFIGDTFVDRALSFREILVCMVLQLFVSFLSNIFARS